MHTLGYVGVCDRVGLNPAPSVKPAPKQGVLSSVLLSSLEFNDAQAYKPYIQALLGNASYFCEVVVLELRTVPIGTALNLIILGESKPSSVRPGPKQGVLPQVDRPPYAFGTNLIPASIPEEYDFGVSSG